ncbi:hypothetical protein HYU06_00495 [Candidatus Woesearchaeota archaeon]|nr:hypothetical protein [Candidatus Woesearchaeota archaeon]
MGLIFDTDILSTFAKINRLYLFSELFRGNELLIPNSVVQDLKGSKINLADVVLNSNIFKVCEISKDESILVEEINSQKNLGRGEVECIAICKSRNCLFVSNDYRAKKCAEAFNIEVFDLESILSMLKEILTDEELNDIIKLIESKDKVKIRNKELLFQKY